MAGDRLANDRPDAGFALLGVLAILMIAGGVLASLTATGIEVHWGAEADHRRFASEQRLLGIARTVAARSLGPPSPDDVLTDPSDGTEPVGPAAFACADGDATLRGRTIDHSGLIDLNAASPKLLRIGFRALGFEAPDDEALARAVVRHRTRDARGTDGRGTDGAVAILHGPKGAPLEAVHELTDLVPLRAVDGALLHRTFTVRSGSGALRLDHAPRHVVEAVAATGMRNEPFVVSGGPDRRPALTVEVERHVDRTDAGDGFRVALEARPDPRRPGGYRVLSVTSGALATRPNASGAVPASADDASCPPWLASTLDGLARSDAADTNDGEVQ